MILPLILLTCVVYPLIYLVFGYYVAWQNETLRIFYTQSSEIKPFFIQLTDAFFNGIYIFQVLRGIIWIAVSIPVVLMLQHARRSQYFLFALLSALLPTTQLFIPNPYMPTEVALTHFIETAVSNFIWGVVIIVAVNKYIRLSTLSNRFSAVG